MSLLKAHKLQFNCQVNIDDSLNRRILKARKRRQNLKLAFCGICAKPCHYPSDLKRHILIHKKKTTQIQKIFTSIVQKKDEEQDTRKRNLVQTISQRDLRSSTGLKENNGIVSNTNVRNKNNLVNKRTFACASLLLKRSRKTHKGNHKCDVCQKSFERLLEVKIHKLLVHSNKKIHKCQVCKREFKYNTKLMEHIRTHLNSKQLSCPVCLKEFKFHYRLLDHIRTHSSEKPFSCQVCLETFKYRSALRRHSCIQLSASSSKMQRLELQKKSKVKRHRKSSKQLNKCDYCQKSFVHKHTLREHIRLHTGELPFSCEVCSRKFRSQRALNDHKTCVPPSRIAHICVVCGLCFSEEDQLKQHSVVHKDLTIYACQVCKKCFRLPESLQEHYKVHSEQTEFSCEGCGRNFKQKVELKKHSCVPQLEKNEDNSNTKELFKCTPCGHLFVNDYQLQKHMEIHNKPKTNKCGICNREFARLGTLREHYWVHTGMKPHHCNVCGKYFSRPSKLQRHFPCTPKNDAPDSISNVSGLDNLVSVSTSDDLLQNLPKYSCQTCQETFTNFQDLKGHGQCKGTNGSPYRCNICSKIFAHRCQWLEHVIVHTGEQPFICSVCNQPFKRYREMKRHMSHKHAVGQSHRCMICGKTFSNDALLVLHYRVHKPPFGCRVCKRKFKSVNMLRAHTPCKISETGEEQVNSVLSCKVCKRNFSNFASLKRHQLTHSGERKFVCHICLKRFIRSDHLKEHLMVHTNERPFVCEVCNQGFTRSINLKRHKPCRGKRSEATESVTQKTHSCTTCGKVFFHLSHLNSHMTIHTGKKPFACNVCNFACRNLNNLKKHKRSHQRNISCEDQPERQVQEDFDQLFPEVKEEPTDDNNSDQEFHLSDDDDGTTTDPLNLLLVKYENQDSSEYDDLHPPELDQEYPDLSVCEEHHADSNPPELICEFVQEGSYPRLPESRKTHEESSNKLSGECVNSLSTTEVQQHQSTITASLNDSSNNTDKTKTTSPSLNADMCSDDENKQPECASVTITEVRQEMNGSTDFPDEGETFACSITDLYSTDNQNSHYSVLNSDVLNLEHGSDIIACSNKHQETDDILLNTDGKNKASEAPTNSETAIENSHMPDNQQIEEIQITNVVGNDSSSFDLGIGISEKCFNDLHQENCDEDLKLVMSDINEENMFVCGSENVDDINLTDISQEQNVFVSENCSDELISSNIISDLQEVVETDNFSHSDVIQDQVEVYLDDFDLQQTVIVEQNL